MGNQRTAVHFLGRLFAVLGAIPRVPNFAEIYARGGRGLLQTASWDLIPPWGHTPGGAAGGREYTLVRAGRIPGAAGTPLGGRQGPGRRGRLPSGGHTGRGAVAVSAGHRRGARWAAARRKNGAARLGGHAGPVAGADARAGRSPAAGRRGGTRGKRGQIRRAARGGYTVGGGGAAAKAARFAPGCVGLSPRQPRRGAAAGKSRVFAYKEAGFSPAFLCRIRAVFARKPCAFHRVAISAAQSDECVAGRKRRGSPPRSRRRGRGKPPGTREEAP